MWRFMLVTFGFLGFAFYELSGGADYAPSAGSIQAVRASDQADAPDRARRVAIARDARKAHHIPPVTTARLQPAAAGAGADLVLATASAEPPADKRLRLTLSRAPDSTGRGIARPTLDSGKAAALTRADPAVTSQLSAEEQAALAIAIVTGRIGKRAETEAETAAEPVNAAARMAGTAADIRTVKGERVNLRGGPGTDYGVVGKLTRGTRVEVLSDNGDGWVELRVEENGRVGWMADWLLVAGN